LLLAAPAAFGERYLNNQNKISFTTYNLYLSSVCRQYRTSAQLALLPSASAPSAGQCCVRD